jgi:hypothetical protein
MEETIYPAAPPTLDSGVAFIKCEGGTRVVDGWEVSILDDNVLPLNDATLYIDGIKALDAEPLANAWHKHFYSAPDGTPFKAEYIFNALDVPAGPLFAAIECAENLDRIALNGHELTPLKDRGELGAFNRDKSWLDISFTKVPLRDYVKKGDNILMLEGKKVNNITGPGFHRRVRDFASHQPTEIEAVYIVGDFSVVDFDNEAFAIAANRPTPCPRDLTSSGYPFYAGRAKFSAGLVLEKPIPERKREPVLLKVTYVEAACIELRVNGKPAGVQYWAPYMFDITGLLKDGNNKIEITAATTLFNLMGPNRHARILDLTIVKPRTFIEADQFTAKYELLPFGIGCAVIL